MSADAGRDAAAMPAVPAPMASTSPPGITAGEISLQSRDGHRYALLSRTPAAPTRTLLWLPALGVAVRHYLPFAEAFAAAGVAVFVHEWRGAGSSTLRASPDVDWGYRELLCQDVPASEAAIKRALPGLPRVIGGHSLGGQVAGCRVALAPGSATEIWLVASGAPYWRAFPRPQRLWLPLAYAFVPWLAARFGYLPGRRIGFGGNEARGLIDDWARTATSGRYAAHGVHTDLEEALERVDSPVHAIAMRDDWMCPPSSTRFLVDKFLGAPGRVSVFDARDLGAPADHYAWMKHPAAVVAHLLATPPAGAATA